jgi:hypothetical protein
LYSANKPLYVSDPRRSLLIVFVIFALLSAFIIVVSYYQIQSSGLSSTDLRAYFYAFLLPIFTAGIGYSLFRATRVEFYENFARVVGRRGAINRDFHYPDLDLGPLIGGGRGSYTFRISQKGTPKPSWRVSNARIRGLNTTLYSFIQGQATSVAKPTAVPVTTTSAAPITSGSFPRRHPFMIAALLTLALMVVGPYYFWSISGPQGTPFIDIEIGSALLFGGIMVLLALSFVRGYLLSRQTDH